MKIYLVIGLDTDHRTELFECFACASFAQAKAQERNDAPNNNTRLGYRTLEHEVIPLEVQ